MPWRLVMYDFDGEYYEYTFLICKCTMFKLARFTGMKLNAATQGSRVFGYLNYGVKCPTVN